MSNRQKEIELRSEEIREILTRPPRALVRWGIMVFFAVLALFFVGGYFFKYPDIITAEITVTTEHPPIWIVSKGSGKIKEVDRADRDLVRSGDIIAVLENPAVTADVLSLKKLLDSFFLEDSCIVEVVLPHQLALGSVQASYASFQKSLMDYRNYLLLNLYEQKIEATEQELQEYGVYIRHLNRQLELDNEQLEIAGAGYAREKVLLEEGLIAPEEHEEARLTYLSRQQTREQLMSSLSSARIQEAQLKQTLIEIRLEQRREQNALRTALQTSLADLRTGIGEWELAYLLASPADGILSYNNIWQANQHVNADDKVFSIVTQAPGAIIGKMKLPIEGAGKVKNGQRVNISVAGYPSMEFGYLTGKVLSVSLLADDESMYAVTIGLPQDLCTSYGKILDFKGELTGSAEVMTDERSVTGRLFSPLRYVWEKSRGK